MAIKWCMVCGKGENLPPASPELDEKEFTCRACLKAENERMRAVVEAAKRLASLRDRDLSDNEVWVALSDLVDTVDEFQDEPAKEDKLCNES